MGMESSTFLRTRASLVNLGSGCLGDSVLGSGRMVTILKANMSKATSKGLDFSLASSKDGSMMDNGRTER